MKFKIVFSVILLFIILSFTIAYANPIPYTVTDYLSYHILIIDYSWDLIILSVSILIIKAFDNMSKRKFFILSIIIFLSGLAVDLVTVTLIAFINKLSLIIGIPVFVILSFVLLYKLNCLYAKKFLDLDKSKLNKIGLMFAIFTHPVIGVLTGCFHTSGITIYTTLSKYFGL
ncbi:MAG TPA: hypothetical protein VF941_00445 [Clostridia bacterium]